MICAIETLRGTQENIESSETPSLFICFFVCVLVEIEKIINSFGCLSWVFQVSITASGEVLFTVYWQPCVYIFIIRLK